MASAQVQTRDQTSRTSGTARVVGLLVYAVGLTVGVQVWGLPKSTVAAFACVWLAVIAWDNRAPWRDHLAFPRDWALPLAVLVVYLYSRGLADDLGLTPVQVTSPIEADRLLFGGTLPTEYLQARLCGEPCVRTLPREWYDVPLTTVYYSHFFVAPIVAGVLWVRHRPSWVHFMRRYLTINIAALAVFVALPVAPPWLAAHQGELSGIARITGRGWYELGPGDFQEQFSAVGNPVAAMPSLHAGIALLVALYAISRLSSPWRWLVLLYPLTMSFALVYFAEHYVVDTLGGWLLALGVWWGCAVWERRVGPQPDTT